MSSPLASDVRWEPAEDGAFELSAPLLLPLCPTPVGIDVADEALRLRVELEAPSAMPRVDTATVTARCPAAQRALCEAVCRG